MTLRSISRPSAPAEGLPAPSWARIRRLSLIRREVREGLAPQALDLLWSQREQIVEGGRELGSRARHGSFFATAMVTIDLGRCAALFSEPADVATAELVAELMAADPALVSRLAALVRPELALLAAVPEAALSITVEHRVRAEGVQILIDGDAIASVDVEDPCGAAAGEG